MNTDHTGHFVGRMAAGSQGEPLGSCWAKRTRRRTGRLEEIGPAAALLSDTLRSDATGTFLVIDGGLNLHPLPVHSND